MTATRFTDTRRRTGLMDKMIKWAKDVERIITTLDYDWIHVNVGPERIGKTTFSFHAGDNADPKFKENFPGNVVFGIAEFKKAVKNSYPGQVLIPDEGALMFFTGDTMTRDVKEGIKMLTVMGAYNLFIIINVPNFWIIHKYIREHRVKSVTHVVRRGWVHYYGPKKVKLIRQDKHKAYKTIWPDYDFRDTFPKFDEALWKLYDEKKKSIVANSDDEVTTQKKSEPNIQCKKCQYKWFTTSIRDYITCPRCFTKGKHPRLTNQ